MDYLRKATSLYMRGKMSKKEYIRRIKENPDRPDYVKMAESLQPRRGMRLFLGLVRGYYHPSRQAGLSRFAALENALRLAMRCLEDKEVTGA